MRHIPRKSLAVSVAAALSLGFSATAFGTGATENTSQVSAGVNPTLLPDTGDTPKKGSLYSQVVTLDANNDNGCTPGPTCFPPVPDQAAEKVTIDFPAEGIYTANRFLDQCALATVATATTDAAAAACADAYIGSGHAFARIPGIPSVNNEVELTVLAFNGETSTAGGGFDGGYPTTILHADNPSLPTTPVLGEVRNSDAGADYGQQLNVPDAPDVAGDVGALVQFGAQVARGYDNGKSGNKKKKYNLITGNCDGGGDGDLDFKATWVYDDGSMDTDTFSEDCTVIE